MRVEMTDGVGAPWPMTARAIPTTETLPSALSMVITHADTDDSHIGATLLDHSAEGEGITQGKRLLVTINPTEPLVYRHGQTQPTTGESCLWRHPTTRAMIYFQLVILIISPDRATSHATVIFNRTSIWSLGIGSGTMAIIIIVMLVLAPFIHISSHVIKTQFVGLFGSYFLLYTRYFPRIRLSIIYIPSYFIKIVASAISIATTALAATCCILPFGLCRQAEMASGQFA